MRKPKIENELDNSLFEEVLKKDTDLTKVRNLVSSGANINAISEMDENLIIEIISDYEADEGNIRYDVINLLIELGIDINYSIEGFNCLFNAWLRYDYKLFELLLENGAEPNCISSDGDESLLDWVKWDRHFEVDIDGTKDQEWIKAMDDIIELLIKYGAKSYKELKGKE